MKSRTKSKRSDEGKCFFVFEITAGGGNEEETRAFLKKLTCDESLHSAVQHTEALDMNVGALTFADLFNGARITTAWGHNG